MNDNNHDNELDPVARLRGADPARNVEPREGFAAEIVAKTLNASASASNESPELAAAEPGAATQAAPVTDLGVERERRRPRWLPYVAVAASLAIVGGAGFGLGSANNGSLVAAGGAAPAISLQSGAGSGTQNNEGALQGMAGGSAASQAKLAPGAAADSTMPYGFGRNSFSSSALSTASTKAKGYTFDARASSHAETVTALAAALGITGTAELKDGAWFVGPQDGSAPSLSVNLDGMLSFYFSDPAINPWDCGMTIMPVEPEAATTPELVEPCTPPTTLPSESAAIDALKALVSAAGRDVAAFEFTSETWEGSFTRNAQAWPVVDGQRIDQPWSIELTDAGTYSASGALAAIISLGSYPVVSEQQAFERLSDPRFGAQMTAMPIALREQPMGESTAWVPPTEPPATPSDGVSISWPVNHVEIVSARLGLTSQWQPDGSVLIVPAYEFTDSDGGTWSVIAVDDSKLNFSGE